jgi:hypothetical protein
VANGFRALFHNTSGNYNTATGDGALFHNTIGDDNTAIGWHALFTNNTINTVSGAKGNTATGSEALFSNTSGVFNTANGYQALFSNTKGNENEALGFRALYHNITGVNNTVTGDQALINNSTGNYNTANGSFALGSNTTGSNNIALGTAAGFSLTTGDNNIDIGNTSSTSGNSTDVAGESNTVRIGAPDTHTATFIAGISGVAVTGTAVVVDSNGQLGVTPSSKRFKDGIKPMDEASEAILALTPVTFHYKSDKTDTPQFGLIAEQVAKVNPDLVVRDKNGEIYTVRYDVVNAMLLNEFLKEHSKVQEQQTTIGQLTSAVAQQQKDFQATVARLTARLDEQASQIQKVSAQVEMSKPAPQTVLNNQ